MLSVSVKQRKRRDPVTVRYLVPGASWPNNSINAHRQSGAFAPIADRHDRYIWLGTPGAKRERQEKVDLRLYNVPTHRPLKQEA